MGIEYNVVLKREEYKEYLQPTQECYFEATPGDHSKEAGSAVSLIGCDALTFRSVTILECSFVMCTQEST